MSTDTLYRWGGLSVIVTAVLFAAGSIALALTPDSGLGSPAAAALYYIGLLTTVPALVTIYAAQAGRAGKLGFAGFVLAVIGSVMYSAPAFLVMAGTANVEGWHSVWAFAMTTVPILLIGPSAFLIGAVLLGVATLRAGVLPRRSGLLLAIGSFLWLLAFWSSVPALLIVANLIMGAGLGWIGLAFWLGRDVIARQPQLQRAA